jgi:D-hydroxyproline dehydrogenase subunit beta
VTSVRVIDADVCVVGAGIVGLAHALEAREHGLRVAVLDRDTRAVGASVRNFGHGIVGAMDDGEALDFALAARERWLELGARAGFEVSQAGSLLVVDSGDELAVIEAVARDERRGAHVIGPEQVARLAPIPTDGVLGAWRRSWKAIPRPTSCGGSPCTASSPDASTAPPPP